MNRTLEEIADDLISHHIGWLSLNEYKRVAILAALTEAREGALREAEDVLQRYLSKQDHQNQTVYDATCIMIENIRLIAPRPSPAAEPAEERVTAARVAFVRQYAEEPVCPVDDRPHLLGCIKCGRPSPRSETTEDRASRCACGRYTDLQGPDECVDDNNRKVHTVARCGFDVPRPGATTENE